MSVSCYIESLEREERILIFLNIEFLYQGLEHLEPSGNATSSLLNGSRR